MNVYVASHDRWAACYVASVLNEADGINVISRWHAKAFNPTRKHTESERAEIALEDFDDINASDALVLISGPDRYPGGKFVEAGIALGIGIPVVVLGHRENMLMWLPCIACVDTVELLVANLLSRTN